MSGAMKFRQRIAWLVVVLYLGGTFAFFYYLFEINDHYNQFALDHVQKFHTVPSAGDASESQNSISIFSRLWGHISDIPLQVWLLVFLAPYLQIFLMILACTRAEPKLSMAFIWPGLLYQKYQQMFKKQINNTIPIRSLSKTSTNGTSNGYNVIHT